MAWRAWQKLTATEQGIGSNVDWVCTTKAGKQKANLDLYRIHLYRVFEFSVLGVL